MDKRNRNLLLAGIVLAVLLICGCVASAGLLAGSYFLFRNSTTTGPVTTGPVSVVTVAAPRAASTATPSMAVPAPALTGAAPAAPSAAATKTSPVAASPSPATAAPAPTAAAQVSNTEQLLAATNLPMRDVRDLALRLRPGTGDIPVVVNATPPSYKVGDTISFWTLNSDTEEHHHISATLKVITPHLYMWVQDGVSLNETALAASANRFESKTYPTDREFFGSEWTPGVDNDVHLSVLHATDVGRGTAGYFSSADEFSHLINPYSNEKEMFVISADKGAATPNTSFYDGVLAHEFQHMIHWYNDRNEESWVNEGMADLAMHLNGYDVGGADVVFARKPDTQLNTWTDPATGNVEHYGAAYLFMDYFLGRFGEDMTKAIVADKGHGINGFNDALERAGRSERFDDIFADWAVANYLNRPDVEPKGRFGYTDIEPPMPAFAKAWDNLPASASSQVSQYAADYIQVKHAGTSDLTVKFDGQTGVGIVDTTPRGRFSWWSNRGDDSDATLTRDFDLTAVKSATLGFSGWWDIEEGYDYVYIEVSTDGGKHWQILRGRQSSDNDKSGNAFGPGWTARSGGGRVPQWIDERVDLSQFAGQKVTLRFEYITDDAVNGPGFLLDDIRIPEINYSDNGENGLDGWDAQGWVLTDNKLTQRWTVQLVTSGSDGVQVQRMDVGPDGHGELTVKNPANLVSMVLIVSATTPVTTEPAPYSYSIASP